MTVLRSREIPRIDKTSPKPSKTPKPIDPSTPSQTTEPAQPLPTPMKSSSARRRSLRLSGLYGESEQPLASDPEPARIHRRVRRRTSVDGDYDVSEDQNVSIEVSEPPVDKGKGKLESERSSSKEAAILDGDDKDNGGGSEFTEKEKGKEKTVEEENETGRGSDNRGEEEVLLPEEVHIVEQFIEKVREDVNLFNQDAAEEIQEAEESDSVEEAAHREAEEAEESDSVGEVGDSNAEEKGSDSYRDIDDELSDYDYDDDARSYYNYGEGSVNDPGLYRYARPRGANNRRDEVLRESEWPGPFSTALGIIRDRQTRAKAVREAGASADADLEFHWTPKKACGALPKPVPRLVDLCLKVLVDNAESLVSLENIPMAFTARMTRMLCDSRRMTARFLKILVRPSPTEIFLTDCSWLAEEDFVEAFQSFDSSILTGLKLDQCGRCLPDYVVLATLGRAPNCLPVLTTLSLCGACRLSNIGLSALAHSAPALTSLNLSQCSLITHSSIRVLAKLFAATLKELYLKDCQGLDALLMLPALRKFEKLEKISLAGNETVCYNFIRGFAHAHGGNMKELDLAGCVGLRDKALKYVAEKCPYLCAIDLSNCKLNDSSLGYLANGCRSIQRLNLSHGSFSDRSVAAFLETSGEHLKELSLNNVKKVGKQTALSIGRRAKKLESLDLSWCRDLTDCALGYIVENCPSLRLLKLFGCTQVTYLFINGHSNPELKLIGLAMTPLLEHLPEPECTYSAV